MHNLNANFKLISNMYLKLTDTLPFKSLGSVRFYVLASILCSTGLHLFDENCN